MERIQKANQVEKREKKQVRKPCLVYGNASHSFTKYYLIQSQDKDWILKENQETFRNNIKVSSFRKKVNDFKAC